jgi:hypothetical protein
MSLLTSAATIFKTRFKKTPLTIVTLGIFTCSCDFSGS